MQHAVQSYTDLIVWQKALALAVDVHRLSDSFPHTERFGLASQLRRAAVSIPSNIAEGAGRRTTRDLISFLYVARGSLAELETQLLLAQQLGYVDATRLEEMRPILSEIGRLLNGLIAGLRKRGGNSSISRR